MTTVGASEGLDFRFERIRHTPNTLASHRLLRLAARYGRQDEMLDALFAAYFTEGRDIGDHRVLIDIAAKVGIPDAVTFLAHAVPGPK